MVIGLIEVLVVASPQYTTDIDWLVSCVSEGISSIFD